VPALLRSAAQRCCLVWVLAFLVPLQALAGGVVAARGVAHTHKQAACAPPVLDDLRRSPVRWHAVETHVASAFGHFHASGAVERITFEGSYNVSPRPFPDGKGLAFVRRDGGRFQIATLDYATKQVQVLTDGPGDESPSIAPNGKLIIYASAAGGRGILAAVSSDGRVKQRLVAPATEVREPAWGPLRRP